jgi:hypothetical protein
MLCLGLPLFVLELERSVAICRHFLLCLTKYAGVAEVIQGNIIIHGLIIQMLGYLRIALRYFLTHTEEVKNYS